MGAFWRGNTDSGGRSADDLPCALKVHLTSLDDGRGGRGGSDNAWSGIDDGLGG